MTYLSVNKVQEKIINGMEHTINSVGVNGEILRLDIESVESMDIQVVNAETGEEVYEDITIYK